MKRNKIIHGDCLEIMQNWQKKSIDLVVTSPPYNMGMTHNGKKKDAGGKRGKWSNSKLLTEGYAGGNTDDMPYGQYVEWQRDCLSAMYRLLTKRGVIFYNHKWRIQGGILQDHRDIIKGFPVRQIIIWNRAGGGINFNRKFFLPTYEVIYLIAKSGFELAKDSDCGMGDIWNFPAEQFNNHPAAFPIALPIRCISVMKPNIVLDPFMGSGTTGVAAKMLNVDYLGIELSNEYVKMAKKRIKSTAKLKPLFK